MQATLISTYELGRQSFGLASAAAWLRDVGAEVVLQDLAVCALDRESVRSSHFVGIHIPMHTATRLADPLIARIRSINPTAHIACFGLYASMNADHLRSLGADSVIGGEFETELTAAYQSVATDPVRHAEVGNGSKRIVFKVPSRAGLPDLEQYARLQPIDGPAKVTGYTEATRGCKHLCRHCPIVPVYGGRFTIVDPDVVLSDISAQVAAGAQHVTFGDPDFFNGPAHGMRVARMVHEAFPDLTYDVTIKVEHLKQHERLLPALADTGCVLVTTAVESFDDSILGRLDKRHTVDDVRQVVKRMREIGLAINPTFVPFTPWTTPDGYLDLLSQVADLGLVDAVAPIQYGIRLLLPAGSLLLDQRDVAELASPFDVVALAHPWRHPDPRMDALHEAVLGVVTATSDRREAFGAIWRLARSLTDDGHPIDPPLDEAVPTVSVPYLTEPWYC